MTKTGEIIQRNPSGPACIYVNGVEIASEDNFLFSYNITSLNTSIRKALNRERTNVGRTAYSPSVRTMLLECRDERVIDNLAKDLESFFSGTSHDELKWNDVQMHTSRLLSMRKNVVFVTSKQMLENNDLVHEAERSLKIVVIPDNLQKRINQENEQSGKEKIKTMEVFVKERSENFDYKFVDKKELNYQEKFNYSLIGKLLEAIGGKPSVIREILISEKMQNDNVTFAPVKGLWNDGSIIIKRSVLNNLEEFVGVLLHEIAHAKSGCTDATRGFEIQLTDLLGKLGASYLKQLMQK